MRTLRNSSIRFVSMAGVVLLLSACATTASVNEQGQSIFDLVVQNKQLAEDNVDLNARIAQLESDLASVQQQVDSLGEDDGIAQLESDLASMQQQVDSLSEDDGLATDVATLRSDLEVARARADKALGRTDDINRCVNDYMDSFVVWSSSMTWVTVDHCVIKPKS